MKPNGYVIYEGPSMLDGSPIVVITTGHASATRNAKTGDMIQTWILRADVEPPLAVKTGADASICGDCVHRGKLGKGRSCYVNVAQGPLNVYRAWKRGRYRKSNGLGLGLGRMVRVGSYGDPAAVPVEMWERLTQGALGWTGYTHQWKTSPHLRRFCMASSDSLDDRADAIVSGWRTFRVSSSVDKLRSEVLCPASKEAGAKTTCAECKLCMGTSTKSQRTVMIPVHGIGKRAFSQLNT